MKHYISACIALLFVCIAAPQSARAEGACIIESDVVVSNAAPPGVTLNAVFTINPNNRTSYYSSPKSIKNQVVTPPAGTSVTPSYVAGLISYYTDPANMKALTGIATCTTKKFMTTASDQVQYSAYNTTCAANQIAVNGKCVVATVCPANATLDAYNSCNCNSGYVRVGNACEARAVCNLGTVDSSNNCTCPSGTSLQGSTKNGTCAMVCNGGTLTTTSNYSTCVCSSGKTLINGTCGCTADQLLINGSCVKKAVCGTNASPNTSNQCVCNAGYISVSGSCVTPVSCPANATANASNQCACNSGYTMKNGSCVTTTTTGTGGGTDTTTGGSTGGNGTTTGMNSTQRQICLNAAMAKLNNNLAACAAAYGRQATVKQYNACTVRAGDMYSAQASLCK